MSVLIESPCSSSSPDLVADVVVGVMTLPTQPQPVDTFAGVGHPVLAGPVEGAIPRIAELANAGINEVLLGVGVERPVRGRCGLSLPTNLQPLHLPLGRLAPLGRSTVPVGVVRRLASQRTPSCASNVPKCFGFRPALARAVEAVPPVGASEGLAAGQAGCRHRTVGSFVPPSLRACRSMARRPCSTSPGTERAVTLVRSVGERTPTRRAHLLNVGPLRFRHVAYTTIRRTPWRQS